MILGLFPDTLAPGGIQRICQHTAAVLTNLAQMQGMRCCLLSLNDAAGTHEIEVAGHRVSIRGFNRDKKRFMLAALKAGMRAELIYIGHPFLAPIGAMVRLVKPRVSYWVAAYGIDVWEPLPRLARWGMRRADAVTALSQFTALQMREAQQLPDSAIKLLPPALDPSFLATLDTTSDVPAPCLPSTAPVILTVTRLDAAEQYKGVDTVIEAMPQVLESVPDACYVIVGDGDDRPRLEALVQEKGLEDHVRFAGVKRGAELAHYYRTCDVFALPSHGEGFGIVFLEAMAFGKPVIGGNHGGTPDVIVSDVTGFLVTHGDTDILASHILALLQAPERCASMGAAGRQRVEDHYTFVHFQHNLTQLLLGETKPDTCPQSESPPLHVTGQIEVSGDS